MSDIAIRVDGLGKRYRIGRQRGYRTLREAITEAVARPLQRPTSSRGQTAAKPGVASDKNHIWALKDVSFEVRQGEVLGVIGRNGSGKSTLLKILSRITEPTEGTAEIRGRVGSLLEVGTGFHPELTGRENILLSGVILGMRRSEIRRKFDEIVDFAEIGEFIDTPVKRYSSGMYVRLAFAVVAHLDPEILILDEVLAVGDSPFQAKCLARIEQLSRTASAVLFVSHNLANVRRLCSMALWLDGGAVADLGPCERVADEYVSRVGGEIQSIGPAVAEFPDSDAPMQINTVRVLTGTGQVTQSEIPVRGAFRIEITYTVRDPVQSAYVLCCMRNAAGVDALWTYDGDSPEFGHRRPGHFVATFEVPEGILAAGVYWVHCGIASANWTVVDYPGSVLAVELAEIDCLLTRQGMRWPAVTHANPLWTTRPL